MSHPSNECARHHVNLTKPQQTQQSLTLVITMSAFCRLHGKELEYKLQLTWGNPDYTVLFKNNHGESRNVML